MQIRSMAALELSAKIKSGEIGVEEAVQACLEQIRRREEEIHAYITVDWKGSLEKAREIQKKITAKELTGPLAGVPAAVKDNLCIEGLPTTCGSKMVEHFVPTYTAQAVKNLEAAGVVVLGKTNMDEFAMGSTTGTSYFGPTRNPWDLSRAPGGSSGGSGAALAAEECFFSLGSDTGGSVRQPAAFCGVTGIKPTYGTVSRRGLVAYASSMDQVGPMAKNAADCAAVLEALISRDPQDSTSCGHSCGNFVEGLKTGVQGLRVGIPIDYMEGDLDPEIRQAVLEAGETLKKAGALVETFTMGMMEYVAPVYYILACAEASSNLSRFDGVKYGYRAKDFDGLHDLYKKSRSQGFGEEVRRRILLGSFVLSADHYEEYYARALRGRGRIVQAFEQAFLDFDVLLSPVTPHKAPLLEKERDPVASCRGDVYTVAANLTGIPAMSIPWKTGKGKLPVGVQIMADRFREQEMLRVAYHLEQSQQGCEKGI